jgi:uncharacterized protein (TIRG00374 family)
MRKILYGILLILAVYFVKTHFDELRSIVSAFNQGDWRWLLVAICVQFLWLINIGATLRSTYRLVDVRERLRHLIPLATAANFVNVIAPSYGFGALAVLISDGRQRGKLAARVSTGAVFYLVYDYFGFLVFLIPGTLILARKGVLDAVLITASIVAASITLVTITLTLLGVRSSVKLGRAITWLAGTVNRMLHPFLHREVIDLARAHSFVNDISEDLQHIRRSPTDLLIPALLAISQKALMATILYLVAVAFQTPLPLDTLLAIFSTSYVFTIASVTPSGVGFVEGAMIVYLHAFQVPLATSAAISLAYRGIIFWLTLVYGMIAIRIVDTSNGRRKESSGIPSGAPLIGDQRPLPKTTIPTESPTGHHHSEDSEPPFHLEDPDKSTKS